LVFGTLWLVIFYFQYAPFVIETSKFGFKIFSHTFMAGHTLGLAKRGCEPNNNKIVMPRLAATDSQSFSAISSACAKKAHILYPDKSKTKLHKAGLVRLLSGCLVHSHTLPSQSLATTI
jgi:hypothetical protein